MALQRENEYDDVTQLFSVHLSEFKRKLWTCLPAEIVSYEAKTRRARVAPLIQMRMVDGSVLDMPEIVNVPVLSPGVGEMLITYGLAAGDVVLLLFSQRGLVEFKKEWSLSSPTPGRMMSMSDALALPGFGPSLVQATEEDFLDAADEKIDEGKSHATNPRAAEENSFRIQAMDGETYLEVSPGRIRMRADQIQFLKGNGAFWTRDLDPTGSFNQTQPNGSES